MESRLTELELTASHVARRMFEGKTVVVTGAGISTDSGLPDFRGRQGLWHGTNLIELLSAEGARRHPEELAEFCKTALEFVKAHRPSYVHEALSKLQEAGYVGTIITQNVDGYHQQAGATNVIEAHGSLNRIVCPQCGLKATPGAFLGKGGLRCIRCGGWRRSEIVLFDEPLSRQAIDAALSAIAETDLLLVMGSTMLVEPVAALPAIVKANGGRIAVFDQEPTALDAVADYVLRGPLEKTVFRLYGYVRQRDRKQHDL